MRAGKDALSRHTSQRTRIVSVEMPSIINAKTKWRALTFVIPAMSVKQPMDMMKAKKSKRTDDAAMNTEPT